MKIGFLIITFEHNYLDNCIRSIRQFYDLPIYIVDNCIHNNNIYCNKNYNDIYYSKNTINSFELGAIWFACKTFFDVDKFIILHNSMIIIEKLPIDLDNCSFMSFWKTISADYSPTVCWVEEKLKEFNIDLEYDKIWYSITGCCCIIDTIYLKKLVTIGYDKIYAKIKHHAVGTEVLFGYLISNVLDISNNSLFEYTLDDNITGKIEYRYIKKIGGGQGYSEKYQKINLSNIKLFNNILDMKFQDINNLNLCYIDLINEIDKDDNKCIQEFLLQNSYCELIYPKNHFSVILSIRHRMFTKHFFPTYYQNEKELILSGKKLLF